MLVCMMSSQLSKVSICQTATIAAGSVPKLCGSFWRWWWGGQGGGERASDDQYETRQKIRSRSFDSAPTGRVGQRLARVGFIAAVAYHERPDLSFRSASPLHTTGVIAPPPPYQRRHFPHATASPAPPSRHHRGDPTRARIQIENNNHRTANPNLAEE